MKRSHNRVLRLVCNSTDVRVLLVHLAPLGFAAQVHSSFSAVNHFLSAFHVLTLESGLFEVVSLFLNFLLNDRMLVKVINPDFDTSSRISSTRP